MCDTISSPITAIAVLAARIAGRILNGYTFDAVESIDAYHNANHLFMKVVRRVLRDSDVEGKIDMQNLTLTVWAMLNSMAAPSRWPHGRTHKWGATFLSRHERIAASFLHDLSYQGAYALDMARYGKIN